MNRRSLTDAQWSLISPYLMSDRSKGGRPPKDHRMMVDAILLVHRTGTPWRDLDKDYGPWESVYTRFRRWSIAGTWEKVLSALAEDRDAESYLIDSTIVRAHQHAAGAKKARRSRR
jgi:transposase